MDISNRRASLAMDQWHMVHIPRSRTFKAANRSFLALLKAENRKAFDPKTEYPIYSFPASERDGMCYIFSPPAVQRFNTFIRVWGGIPVSEPNDLNVTLRVL